MAGRICHEAPGEKKYESIRYAGEKMLSKFCENYPQTDSSFLLPVLFQTNHPENVELSESDQRGLKGLNMNRLGEQCEYAVYKAFRSLTRQSPKDSILGLFGYKIDDNGHDLKKGAIESELPDIDFTDVNTRTEYDAIIVVRNSGVILCEVKSSANAENLKKAEEQLINSEMFVKRVMAAIDGATPSIKLIIVPAEQSKPTSSHKHNDCHVFYGDDLDFTRFCDKWSQLVSELQNMPGANPISDSHIQHLTQFIVGVWAMKPSKKPIKRRLDFDHTAAALSSELLVIDRMINEQKYALTKDAKKLTRDIKTSTTDVFQRVKSLSIMYLTPRQKHLYDRKRHALIHAHAGTGKTILIVSKIIDILDRDPSQNVVVVAPNPHHHRIQEFLNKHNIKTDVVKTFPYTKSPSCCSSLGCQKANPESKLPSATSTSNVLIMTVQDFFKVPRETLMMYDLSNFNVFVDDLHSYSVPNDENVCTYSDIGDFIDATFTAHNTASSTHHTTPYFLWFAYDLAQGQWKNEGIQRPDRLFLKDDGNERTFSIPVFPMTEILRNCKEVADLVDKARTEQIIELSFQTTHLLENISCGHHITTGEHVLYEKLKQQTDATHRETFLCERIRALLCDTVLPTNTYFSAVAILFHDPFEFKEFQPALKEMMNTNFNVSVRTIEEHILKSNDNDLLVDHCGNIQSFECPTVVYVRSYGSSTEVLYNGISRARTRCVIIDVETNEPPFDLSPVDLIEWEWRNGVFVKI